MDDIKAREPIPERYKEWFRADLRHAEEWRKEAQTDYEFRDGKQYSDDEERILEEQSRPTVVFNRVGAIIDAVSGQEISNRQEVRYIPREPEDNQPTELFTSASQWFRDQADADDNDSEAFRDTITGGMGWTETRLEYEDNPDGELRDDRTDPFEMVWDYNARKNNLIDANRFWRVRKLPMAEARAFAESMGVDGLEDDDLHAAWASHAVWDGNSSPSVSESVRDRSVIKRDASGELEEAVIVHCQWIEREDVWRVPMPGQPKPPQMGPDGQPVPQEPPKPVPTDMSAEEYAAFKEEGKARGIIIDDAAEKQIGIRKRKKKVRYQAFLGNVVLKVMPTACPDQFNFKCITAKRDQAKGQFYGIVRTMRDPQSWSNKLYSQILHIINSQAKGGILVERGAFDNDADAEESWARSDRMTFVKPGKLSGQNPAWAPKPVAQTPPALQYLMEIAGQSIHQVSGVNMELLGMREADQAGVLEYQRRQAGLTILQPIFDNLKAYRREQGELILWYIQNDLSDGRLIRIVGKQQAEYVPLIKDATLEYDVIVADSPTSPNQKEKNWQLITQMMPFIKDMMTPEVALALAEDSPLQSATIQKLQKLSQQASESPQAKLQERMGQLEAAVLETKAMLQQAQAEKAKADAQAAMNQQPVDPQAELAIKAQESQGKLQLSAAETQAKIALEREKAGAQIGMAREKQAGDMAMQSREMQFGHAMQAQDQAQTSSIRQREADTNIALQTRTTDATIAQKDKQAKAAAKRKPATSAAR